MFKFIVYIGVILITTGVAYGDLNYLKVHKILATWDEANLQCEQEGRHLASPINSEVLRLMRSVMSNNKIYHIGTRAGYSPGTYLSREGIPLINMTEVMDSMVEELDPELGECLSMDQFHIIAAPCWVRLPYMCSEQQISHCDNGYEYNSAARKCYKVHWDRLYTWDEGSVICVGEGGRLAIVENENDKQAIKNLYKFPSYSWIFIGMRDVTGSGDWMTVDGRRVERDSWPDDIVPVDRKTPCGAMHEMGKLHHLACDNTRHFICEKHPTVTKTL